MAAHAARRPGASSGKDPGFAGTATGCAAGSRLPKARAPRTLAPRMVAPESSPLPERFRTCALVLCRTQGPVNLGMVARLCGNLGITDLRLVAPICAVDCPEARMFSTHSRDFMLAAPVYPDLRSAVADCGMVIGTSARVRDGMNGEPLLPQEVPALLAERPSERWALVFGNEADGLSDEEMLCCQAFVRLRTYGENYSFNLSHAVAITCYTLAEIGLEPPARGAPLAATRGQVDHLLAYWLHTLDRFQYFRRTERERFAPQLERMLNRLQLSDHDVQMLWGMFSQFNIAAFGDRAEPGHDPARNQRGRDRPPG
jgi:TrmH family RNA methyltransferase